jgi:hypothetical protein
MIPKITEGPVRGYPCGHCSRREKNATRNDMVRRKNTYSPGV